ncbi:MAG: hypothetical protein ACK4ND_18715, partial [Cytophagaceae bacterium]
GNDTVFNSHADWFSPTVNSWPGNDPYKVDPPVAGEGKVIILDTDHIWGIGDDRKWVWKSFMRGCNPIYMDDMTKSQIKEENTCNGTHKYLCKKDDYTDGLHGYENANEPFKYQKMFRIEPIHIKQGCWIRQNVVILPGVTVGEFSIIGANSVVNKSILIDLSL